MRSGTAPLARRRERSDTGYLPIDCTNEAYKFGVNCIVLRADALISPGLPSLMRLLAATLCVSHDESTCDSFSRIAAALRAKGTPIPSNDIWMAAHAMEAGAELLSSDAHDRHVDGLAWVRPADA